MEIESIYCPWCHKYIALCWLALISASNHHTIEIKNPVIYEIEKDGEGEEEDYEKEWSVGVCPSCRKCVLVEWDEDKENFNAFPYPTYSY